MGTTTHEQLKIISPFSISHILNLSIEVIPNEHSRLHMRCILDSENFSLDTISKSYENEKIEVLNTENGEKVFSGIIENFNSSFTNGYYEVELYAISGTIFLDLEKKSKSFQDVQLLYYYLIRQVLKETSKASYVPGDEWNKPIELPIIQYNETDWEFMKRLASHFNTSVIPEITRGEPKFYFGMPKGKNRGVVETSEYQVGIRDKYWTIGGEHLGFSKTDFLYYRISSDQNFQIGDEVSFLNLDLKVCEKHVELKKDILVFYYILSKDTFISEHTLYNDQISGSTIWGTVLETNQETLKVHLDIDETQDVATAYPYEWAPETGDLFYMMPQVGTRVGLYFYNADERSGKTVRCIRTNGGKENSTVLMDDYEKRILWTEHNKKMLLYPEELTFFGVCENPEKPLMMSLKDEEGIAFNTEHSIQMIANKEIQFEAPMVCLSSLAGSTFAKLTYTAEDMLAQLAPDFEEAKSYILAIDNGGKEYLAATSKGTVYYAGQVFRECEKIDDAPKEGEFDWGKWGLNILAGIATVVVVTVAVAGFVAAGVLTGGATLVATVAVVGTFTVGANSYSDFKSGNVRDTSDMVLSVGGAMIFAAVSGGLLPKFSLVQKFISTPFAQVLGKVLSNPAGIGAITSLISAGKQFVETGDFKPRSTVEQGVQAGITAQLMKDAIEYYTPAVQNLMNKPVTDFTIWRLKQDPTSQVTSFRSPQLEADMISNARGDAVMGIRNPNTGETIYAANVGGNIYGYQTPGTGLAGANTGSTLPNVPAIGGGGNLGIGSGTNPPTLSGGNFLALNPPPLNPSISLTPAYAAYLASILAPAGAAVSVPSNIAAGGITGGGYVGATLSSPIKRPVLGLPPSSGGSGSLSNGGGSIPPSSGGGNGSPSKGRESGNGIDVDKKDVIYYAGRKSDGTVDWELFDRYINDVQLKTGLKIPEDQMNKVKAAWKKNKYSKLSKDEIKAARISFNNNKNSLIEEWEKNTGQTWPTYSEDIISEKTGQIYIHKGDKYDAHHLIELSYGGEETWWNIHPAKRPSEHQGGIHGSGSSANEIFK